MNSRLGNNSSTSEGRNIVANLNIIQSIVIATMDTMTLVGSGIAQAEAVKQQQRGEVSFKVTDLSFHRATWAVVGCQKEFMS